MRTRCGHGLVIALALAVLLTGCASTLARQDSMGMPNAENPEYLANPFRVAALFGHLAGNIIQYVLVEPFYFAMNTMPDAVGLSLEEQRYLDQRQQAWAKGFDGVQQ